MRGSQTTSRPRSVSRADQAARALLQRDRRLGDEVVGERRCGPAPRAAATRASTSGSPGGGNGSLSMTTHCSASPGTSMPSQKLCEPTSTGARRCRGSAASAGASATALHQHLDRRRPRPRTRRAAARRSPAARASVVVSTMVRPPSARGAARREPRPPPARGPARSASGTSRGTYSARLRRVVERAADAQHASRPRARRAR